MSKVWSVLTSFSMIAEQHMANAYSSVSASKAAFVMGSSPF